MMSILTANKNPTSSSDCTTVEDGCARQRLFPCCSYRLFLACWIFLLTSKLYYRGGGGGTKGVVGVVEVWGVGQSKDEILGSKIVFSDF